MTLRSKSRRASRRVAAVTTILALCVAGASPAAVLHVNGANPTPGNGASWAAAFDDLQDALAVAQAADEIWVAAGTYRPTVSSMQSVSFVIPADVAVYGGFAGAETLLVDRDPVANPTILSGDIGTPDLGTDNSFNVVRMTGGTTTRLDGVTVTRGAGLGTSEPGSDVFSGGLRGGGVFVSGGTPTLHRVRFVENGSGDAGLQGGAFASVGAADPLLVDVSFVENAGARGGALYSSSALRLVNVTFAANAGVDTLTTIDGGGAAFFDVGATVDAANVVAWGNTFRNLLGTAASSFGEALATSVDIRASLLEGSGGSAAWNPDFGNDLGGNLDADPQFVDLAGRDLRLLARSPAIDTGDPAFRPAGFDVDLDGRPRTCGLALDMGALEFQGIDCAPFDGNWSIATTGSDVATGLPGDPFASVARAVDVAAWGDTLVFEAGTYAGLANQDVDLGDKALTLRSADGDPASVTFDFGGAAGLSFQTTSVDSTTGPRLRGLTFTNATTAVEIDGIFGPGQPVVVDVADCRFVGNTRGLDLRWTVASVRNTDFIGNANVGLVTGASGITVTDGSFQGNATGGNLSDLVGLPWAGITLRRTNAIGNDTGLILGPETSTVVMDSCVVDSNAAIGMVVSASSLSRAEITDSFVRANGTGIRAAVNLELSITRCLIADNVDDGVVLDTDGKNLEVIDSEIRDNGGWGVDGTSGVARTALKRDTVARIDVLGSTIRGNAAGGLTLDAETMLLENSLLVENGGRGFELFLAVGFNGDAGLDVVGSTLANNLSDGFWTDMDSVTVDRTLIVGNTGAAFATTSANTPVMTCSNVFGNGTDYAGVLTGLQGVDGNVSADPLFCDPSGGEYTVISISPCLPAASGCGLIGARGQGCSAEPVIASIADVGNDQGGRVRLTWDASHYDAPGGATVVTGYGVYRKQAVGQGASEGSRLLGWDYIDSVPARGDAGYQFVAETLCDSTAAEGVCWTTFFVSAETASPFEFFDSAPDSGYSVDDLAPEPTQLVTVDYGATSNRVEWAPSIAPDLDQYLVYRVDDPAIVPTPADVPLGTSVLPSMVDGDFGGGDAWDFSYWVVAVDQAGNRSAPVLQATATATPGADRVTQVELQPNVPNPFNPATEIAFALPNDGPVTLRIYDVRGRTVRTLVDGVVSAGRHRARWDGRDDTGRAVASGTYFYRLRANGVDRSRSMLLLK